MIQRPRLSQLWQVWREKHCKAGRPLLEGWRQQRGLARDGCLLIHSSLFLPVISVSVNFAHRRASTRNRRGTLAKVGFWRVLALLAMSCPACGPIVENAPFAVRPDTLRPGDLLGPYDGVIVDAETERPIASATVSASWAFERGIGMSGPAGVREFSMETSGDGKYVIPQPDDLPTGGSMRLRRFTLVVYRRGYVAYRSDFKFESNEIRHDFSQHGNKVRLEKWRSSQEHRRHLAFLGGGEAISKAASWEAQPASLEYEGRATQHAVATGAEPLSTTEARAAEKLLDASPLLSVEEVRGVTGFAGEFEVGRLTDRVRSDVFDSRHFKAKDKPESYDVGVRVWLVGTAIAEAEFKRLMGELPAAKTTEEIGDQSLRARGGDVSGLAFLLRERGIVVQISCGVAQCTESGMILRLAKLVESHLGELGTTPQSAGADAAKPREKSKP